MFIQMGLTWVMGWELSVVVVEPPLHPVFFSTRYTFVVIPSTASCKLKRSLYHLIHSSITHMLTLCPFCNGGRATPPSDAACHIGAAVVVISVAACKLKHSLYHLIHSSITRMLMMCPSPPSNVPCACGTYVCHLCGLL